MKTTKTRVRVIALATIAVSTVVTAETIVGTAGPDNLTGTPGADFINGRGGADTMTGLAGNDTYVVNDEADKVVEQAGGGTDTVRVFGFYKLPANVENLKVAGSADGGGIGNDRANRMVGNDAFNTLDGGPGNDTLTGRGGADDFIFNDRPFASTPNVDRVTDFNVAEDSLVLDGIAFELFGGGGESQEVCVKAVPFTPGCFTSAPPRPSLVTRSSITRSAVPSNITATVRGLVLACASQRFRRISR